mgnify:CR=1 FL=1
MNLCTQDLPLAVAFMLLIGAGDLWANKKWGDGEDRP